MEALKGDRRIRLMTAVHDTAAQRADPQPDTLGQLLTE